MILCGCLFIHCFHCLKKGFKGVFDGFSIKFGLSSHFDLSELNIPQVKFLVHVFAFCMAPFLYTVYSTFLAFLEAVFYHFILFRLV